LKSPLPLMLI